MSRRSIYAPSPARWRPARETAAAEDRVQCIQELPWDAASRGGYGGGGGSLFGFGGGQGGGLSSFYPVIIGGIVFIVAIALYVKRKWILGKIRKQ